MAAIIAMLTVALRWMVASYIGQWIMKALLALGIGLFATKVALPDLKAWLISHASGLSSTLFQVFGAVGGDVAFTMILSAYAAAVTGNIAIRALKK